MANNINLNRFNRLIQISFIRLFDTLYFFERRLMQKIVKALVVQVCLLISGFAVHGAPSQASVINKKQAAQYINQVIDNLFSARETSYHQDLEQFKRTTRDSLLNTLGFYPSFHALSHVYNTHDLREGILSQVTVFIEKKTRNYVQNHIQQIELPDHITDQALIRTVVDTIRGSLVDQLSNAHDQAGLLSSYIGSALKERINKIVNNEIRKPESTSSAYSVTKHIKQKSVMRDRNIQDEEPMTYIPEKRHSCKPIRYPSTTLRMVEPVPVMPVMPYQPCGYAVEVIDVYEPAYGYMYEPVYRAPGFSFGAGIPLGNGFLDFQFNI